MTSSITNFVSSRELEFIPFTRRCRIFAGLHGEVNFNLWNQMTIEFELFSTKSIQGAWAVCEKQLMHRRLCRAKPWKRPDQRQGEEQHRQLPLVQDVQAT
jgi:hypothetical protein